jgi:hypothetical protein
MANECGGRQFVVLYEPFHVVCHGQIVMPWVMRGDPMVSKILLRIRQDDLIDFRPIMQLTTA